MAAFKGSFRSMLGEYQSLLVQLSTYHSVALGSMQSFHSRSVTLRLLAKCASKMLLTGSNKKRSSSSLQQRGYSSGRGYHPQQQQRAQPSQYHQSGSYPGSTASSTYSGRGTPTGYSGATVSSSGNSDRQPPSTSHAPSAYDTRIDKTDTGANTVISTSIPPPPPPPPQASVSFQMDITIICFQIDIIVIWCVLCHQLLSLRLRACGCK
jgi:hypothetical protein